MSGITSRINGQKGGRPQGSENSDTKKRREMKNRWLDRVYGVADKIFDAHLDLALGHYAETQPADGAVRVYKRSPDARSLHWIMEQVWGRAGDPVQSNEVCTNENEPLSEEMQRSINQAIDFAFPNRKRIKSTRFFRPFSAKETTL